jgi:hypothetical protein
MPNCLALVSKSLRTPWRTLILPFWTMYVDTQRISTDAKACAVYATIVLKKANERKNKDWWFISYYLSFFGYFHVCLANSSVFELCNLIANAQLLTTVTRSKISSPVLSILARQFELHIKCVMKGLDF